MRATRAIPVAHTSFDETAVTEVSQFWSMSWILSGLGVGYRVHVAPSKWAATVKSPSPAWAC